jgi:hypothetical protein
MLCRLERIIHHARHKGQGQSQRIGDQHVAGQGIAVAQAVQGVGRQVEYVPQGIDEVAAAVGVVDRRAVNVGVAVPGDGIARLRHQAVGLGELADEGIGRNRRAR